MIKDTSALENLLKIMLTQEEILQIRKRLGIQNASSISGRQKLAAEYDAKNTKKPGYFQRVGQGYAEAAGDIGAGIQEGANLMAKPGILNKVRGAATSALRTVGGVAEAAFNPILEAPGIKQGTEWIGENIAKIPGADKLAMELKQFSEQHPELSKDFKNIIDISTLGIGKTVEKPIVSGLEKAGASTLEGTSKVLSKVKPVLQVPKKSLDYFSNRFPKLLSIATGESSETIAAALKNPKIADDALKMGVDKALRQEVVKGAENTIKLRNNFFKSYLEAKQKVLGEYNKTLIPKNNLVGDFNKLLKENKVIIDKGGVLNFTKSQIQANPGEITKINQAFDALRNWDKFDVNSLDEYKQLVGKLTKFANEAGIPSKSPTLGRWYNRLDETIKQRLPKELSDKYKVLNKNFSENIELYDDMVDAFNSGEPFTRLANALGKNKDSLRQVLDFYEQQTGRSPITVTAARELAMEKQAAFGFLNPRSWIDFFWSPENQAKAIIRVGELKNKTKK